MKKVVTSSLVIFSFFTLVCVFAVLVFSNTVQTYSVDLSQGVPAFRHAVFLSVGSMRSVINDVSSGFVNFVSGIRNFFGNVGNGITDAWNSFIQGVANATAGIYNFLFGWINS